MRIVREVGVDLCGSRVSLEVSTTAGPTARRSSTAAWFPTLTLIRGRKPPKLGRKPIFLPPAIFKKRHKSRRNAANRPPFPHHFCSVISAFANSHQNPQPVGRPFPSGQRPWREIMAKR
jgi:hypothetical protein